MRSGLSVVMDHPRLYSDDDCTPGSEGLRLTPLTVPNDRVWTAKEDARYISPLIALPGYRHTVGMARSWHFITDYGFILTGAVYVIMLLVAGNGRGSFPNVVGRLSVCVANLRPLRDLSISNRAGRFLRVQLSYQ